MSIAHSILIGVGAYVVVGVVFASAFVTRGVGRIDAAARGASPGFRLLIFPASAALWPLLLQRWLRARRAAAASSEDAH
ncbi:MAG: hypothetical protein AB7Q17_12880 [Phycisphaerae bacterium]